MVTNDGSRGGGRAPPLHDHPTDRGSPGCDERWLRVGHFLERKRSQWWIRAAHPYLGLGLGMRERDPGWWGSFVSALSSMVY